MIDPIVGLVWWVSPFPKERKDLASCPYAICTAAARSAAQSDCLTSPSISWIYLNTRADQSDACSSCSINSYDHQPHEDLAPGWSEPMVGTTPTSYWTRRAGIWLVSLHTNSHSILVVRWGNLIGLQRYKSCIGMTPDPFSLLRRGWPSRL